MSRFQSSRMCNTLKMEAADLSETEARIYHTTRRYITDNLIFMRVMFDNRSESLLTSTVWIKSFVKAKVRPTTSHEGPEGEQRYSSTPSLTSALDGVGG